MKCGERMINKTDIKQRFTRLEKIMSQKGCQNLIAYSNAAKPDNVFYLSGYNLYAGEAWAVFNQKGEVSLWFTEAWDAERAKEQSWAEQILLLEPGQLPTLPTEGVFLSGLNIMPRKHAGQLQHVLSDAKNGNSILEEAVLVRTTGDMNYLRKAAQIADQGFQSAVEVLRPGITQLELLAEIEYTMRRLGATDNFQLMASGTHNKSMAVGTEKQIESGDVLLFEITPAVDSITYSAQLCRTITMGKASDVIKEKYAILKEAMESAIDIIRPGVTICEVFEVQNKVFRREGYGEYCMPPYMRTRGHGLGLAQAFNVDADNHLPLEEGMSLVIHPNQYIPEIGYLTLGEMILVTASGCESLTTLDHNLVEK